MIFFVWDVLHSANQQLLQIGLETQNARSVGVLGRDMCDQEKTPNVYKSCPKMISLEKW